LSDVRRLGDDWGQHVGAIGKCHGEGRAGARNPFGSEQGQHMVHADTAELLRHIDTEQSKLACLAVELIRKIGGAFHVGNGRLDMFAAEPVDCREDGSAEGGVGQLLVLGSGAGRRARRYVTRLRLENKVAGWVHPCIFVENTHKCLKKSTQKGLRYGG
jgi:hypothetical protein